MICARRVHSCFRTLERLGDRITGAAGPYFVGLAVILMSLGVACFFDVIAPDLSYPLLSIPFCLLITLNLLTHYFYVCTVPPGFIDEPLRDLEAPRRSLLWARKRDPKGKRALTGGVRWSDGMPRVTPASLTRCRKCMAERPERTHHCRICNRCVLKYDHHCPVRINQCVGLHNERHFVLFMTYLVLATFCFSILGYPHLLDSLGLYYKPWPYRTPEIAFALTYILSVVLCFAVGVLGSYHLYSVSNGETAVEAQDFEHYRRRAEERGEKFVNSYDLGRVKNLQLLFNLGENGYPLYTLLLPLRVPPYTDGRSWARRPGCEQHIGIRRGEELTDEEDGNDGGDREEEER